jgi:cbb3-type cytochrome oxidase cytochrome c subunit
MAATDQTYRNQRRLDVVFGVSCLLMLASLVWMFYDDQYRDWKKEQRHFRDVEEAMAQREVIRKAPDRDEMDGIDKAQKEVVAARQKVAQMKEVVNGNASAARAMKTRLEEELPKVSASDPAQAEQIKADIAYCDGVINDSKKNGQWMQALAAKIKSEQRFQDIKADLDSKNSFFAIAIDKRSRATHDPEIFEGLAEDVKKLREEIKTLTDKLTAAQNEVDANKAKLAEISLPLTAAEKELSDKEDNLKKLTADFDRFHKLAEQKRWGAGDWFRNLPVIDAFAAPIKIQQYTLDDLTIDYSFKRVTRYDRCTTCHLGIDRPTFTREALRELGEKSSQELRDKLKDARYALRQRGKIAKTNLNPEDVQLKQVKLSDSQINAFSAHPRLDLFVEGNSPHPAEKFGCSICHAGQGSSTSFLKAAHTPNNSVQQAKWAKDLDWEHDHNWDFPMLPRRFIESSCVKCHHQITDLIREGSRDEAPKLLRGYNLVRENGCFGCHEIAGIKGGRSVGPDLRLEPTPPLDAYTPAEKTKMTADPLNPPGAMRKVGPSLRRLSEKTNRDWLKKWIRAPRDFRPDTKMPHFFGLANNSPDMLPPEQRDFPDAEINSIAHYLMTESENYLNDSDLFRKELKHQLQRLLAKEEKLRSEKENRDIEEITRRLELFKTPKPLWKRTKDNKDEVLIVDAEGKEYKQLPPELKDKALAEQLKRGRQLFSEKGCLACHQHEATAKKGDGLPALPSDAHFGPNLTRLAAKLGTGQKDSARAWLVQWILDPMKYHPRTFMPYTHLDLTQANDVATWLLAQKTDWAGPEIADPRSEAIKLALRSLAAVYLNRIYSPSDVKDLLGKANGFSSERVKDMRLDQDERELEKPLDEDKLMRYVGKKAINQYGCFGCHDIPGFEYAKPIGTPLNDWGKKDPERLAFEDADAFVRRMHGKAIVPLRDDPKDPSKAAKDWKVARVKTNGGEVVQTPYEKFFYEALSHHQREGFLHQKLMEPRSYDYDRLRVWDDRLRMPQFRFSRRVAGPSASDEEKAAVEREEALAREAVMTFILGLVAEPVPVKYVNRPAPERLAEVEGRKVIDKFNCAGCHLVRPGVYEFKQSTEVLKALSDRFASYASGEKKTNHFFGDHNAWVGQPPTRPDRLTVFGVNPQVVVDDDTKIKSLSLRLTHALRVPGKAADGKPMDLPASTTIILPVTGEIEPGSPPLGGTFGNLLTAYLVQLDPIKNAPDDRENAPLESKLARPKVPPALLREGEKTQPQWLYQFLRNPESIRPQVVLRMPKFNMSEEDARALVTYFAAADKIANPGLGLNYPYFSIPERDDGYLSAETARYLSRLRSTKVGDTTVLDARIKQLTPLWEIQVKDRIVELEAGLKAVDGQLKQAKENEDKENDKTKKEGLTLIRQKYENDKAAMTKELDEQKNELKDNKFPKLRQQWETQGAYLADAYRLATNLNTCTKCHNVGNVTAADLQAPPLHLAAERLRPEWVQRWVAFPERFTTYPSPMPPYFGKGQPPQFQESFIGDPDEQVKAMRDFLMNYRKAVDMPINRNRPTVLASGGK